MGYEEPEQTTSTGVLGKRTLPMIDADLDWLLGQVNAILERVTRIEQRLSRVESSGGSGSSGGFLGGYPW